MIWQKGWVFEMKIEMSSRLQLGFNTQAGDVVDFLTSMPSTARISVYHYSGGNDPGGNDPREHDSDTLIANWTEER